MCKHGIILRSANLVEALIAQLVSITMNAIISSTLLFWDLGPNSIMEMTITAMRIRIDYSMIAKVSIIEPLTYFGFTVILSKTMSAYAFLDLNLSLTGTNGLFIKSGPKIL